MSLDDLRATAKRHDLLSHSFYQRWVAGELSLDELRDYACQYAHVVDAIPRWLDAAARGAASPALLRAHAREETAHVSMWADFAEAIGVGREELAGTAPNEATRSLLDAGDRLAADGDGAAAVWALEAQTPAVAAEKMDGLKKHYGIDGGRGGRYFELHRTLDVDHANELEAMIASDPSLAERAPAVAETMLGALWGVLSSVEHPVAAA